MTRYLIRITAVPTLVNSYYPAETLCRLYFGYQGDSSLKLLWMDANNSYWENNDDSYENELQVIDSEYIKVHGFIDEKGAQVMGNHQLLPGLKHNRFWDQSMDIIKFEF